MPGIAVKIDLTGSQELGKALGWFLSLGKDDTQHIRDELQDLLSHVSQTLKSLWQLTEALYQIKEDDFNTETFLPVFFHCSSNFTDPEAARKARSHCTDIERDIERIQFKLTKVLRTEVGRWKSLDDAFERFTTADKDFLEQFEVDMRHVGEELLEIARLVTDDQKGAWERYERLRSALLETISKMQGELAEMRQAEDHIRRILT